MRDRQSVIELPPPVNLPSGNVHVLPASSATADDPATSLVKPNETRKHKPTGGWEIHDGDGAALEPTLKSRAEALRYMCVVGLRGVSLPLRLYGPDGRPTGDRLA